MSETLSLFDLIASVDAMTLTGLTLRPAVAVNEVPESPAEAPRISAGAAQDESFSLQNESDTMTFYEVDGFGVGIQKIYDHIVDDNVRLRKIFELYSRPAPVIQKEPAKADAALPAAGGSQIESSARGEPPAASEQRLPSESESQTEPAVPQSDAAAEDDAAADDVPVSFPAEALSNFARRKTVPAVEELPPAQKKNEAAESAEPELFVESGTSSEPELFFEDEPEISERAGEVADERPAAAVIDKIESPAAEAPRNENEDRLLEEGEVEFEGLHLDSAIESVGIDDEWYEEQVPTRESHEPVHHSMHSPVSHYPLGEDELEDIEADIEAEPSLIIEERLDDIYERLSECRRTGIDITDSVILLDSDRDIERLINSKTPLGSNDLKKLLNHFDQLIGKLPDEEREAFARSEYFSLYLHVMNQLEEQPAGTSESFHRH